MLDGSQKQREPWNPAAGHANTAHVAAFSSAARKFQLECVLAVPYK